MKKIIGTVICLFILFTIRANAQLKNKEGYFIKGNFNGLDSGVVRMLSSDGNGVMDSSVIVNGKFSMKGKIGLPKRMLFKISPGNWSFRAFVEDTIITLSIDTTGAQHHDNTKKGGDKWSLIWEIDEVGAMLSDVYDQFINETHQKYYQTSITNLVKKLKAVEANADTKNILNREIDSVKMLALAEQRSWIENYVSKKPSSIAGVFLFSEFYQSSPQTSVSYLDSILHKFTGPAVSSDYFKEMEGIAVNLKNAQPNSVAPDFTLLKRDKSTFKFSSTRGNYTMLDFWASWCLPCRKAIPDWKKVYSKFKQKGLIVVSVSNDRNWDDWTKALDKEIMPWVQVIDEFPGTDQPAVVSELFGVNAFPFYILIDKDGRVILSSDDEDLMKEKIEEIFK